MFRKLFVLVVSVLLISQCVMANEKYKISDEKVVVVYSLFPELYKDMSKKEIRKLKDDAKEPKKEEGNLLMAEKMKYKNVKVDFVAQIAYHHIGLELIKYSVVADGELLGNVFRVQSTHNDKKEVDMLVRYGKKGIIIGVRFLKGIGEGKTVADMASLEHFFQGKNMEKSGTAMHVVLNGLAAGAQSMDLEKAVERPKDHVVNLKGHVMEVGDKLPALSVVDVLGNKLDLKKSKKATIILFLDPSFDESNKMLQSVQNALLILSQAKNKTEYNVVYILNTGRSAAVNFAKEKGMGKYVVADEVGMFAKLFKAQLKPYGLLFTKKGVLHAPLVHIEEEKTIGIVMQFLGYKFEEDKK